MIMIMITFPKSADTDSEGYAEYSICGSRIPDDQIIQIVP